METSHTPRVLPARFSSNALPRAVVLCFALLLSVLTHAVPEPGFSVQIFQSEQGLPQNNINSILQSRDGYLWLATFGGLVRFDGVRFKVFDSANTPQLQNGRISSLFEDSNDAMWIGHETGDLTRFSNGRFEPVSIPGAPHREPIVAITTDSQGAPILFYQSGAIRNARSGALMDSEISAEQQRGSTTFVRDGDGSIWILRSGALSRLTNGKVEPVEFDRFAADQQVSDLGAALDGGVWIATAGRVRKRAHNQWTDEIPVIWRPTSISAMLEMRNGTLAIATTDQGIYLMRRNAAPFHLDRNDGLPPDWVRNMCEDREGNLWVAFGSGGLAVMRPARVTSIGAVDRWKGRPVLSVSANSKDDLWVGTEGSGLYRYSYGKCIPVIGDQAPSTNSFIWSFAEDDTKRLWISSAENGLITLMGERFQTPQGLEDFNTPIRALFQSPSQHALFLGGHSGLLKWQNQNLETLATNLVLPDVRCITEQPNGVIWFGMFGGGLGKLEYGVATQFRKTDGLASDFVQCLYFDASENALWIGTAESGLNRYKTGHFASISTAQGLRDNVICHIADDGRGNFWISSHAGIMRLSKAELNACAEGQTQSVRSFSLSETDGVPSAQGASGIQPTGCRTFDGTLWFATAKGIAAIDPKNIRTNQLPIALIEELRLNDAPIVSNNSSNRIEIKPGRHRFDFDYTAINFAAPDRILFKYRLDPLDPDWVGPTTKRTVSYSHIPPGDYTFHVMACNSDGAWNEADAKLAFTLLPFFYQTLWFRIVSILVAIGFVGLVALLGARQRYRRRLELAERQRGIERERARIAQDIHDDLGSSLTRIILLSQSARGDLDSPELAATDLDRIYDTARNLTRSLDEIVWAVNPRHDTLDSLATYLGKFAQDFLGAANIRCRLDLPVSVPPWPLTAETRHNVFLAFKEALNNAVKHAQATEVRVALTLDQSAFTLTVEDNGRGFSPQSIPAKDTDTEDGLANMRKRLTEVGGNCAITSNPNKGTHISFRVPVVELRP